MSQENFGDGQDQQDQQDQGLGEAAYGDQQAADHLQDESKAIEEQKAYGDSSTAVTPDTQQPPQGEGAEGSFGGESSRGESAVFGESDQGEQGQHGETSYGEDQDAESSQPGPGEPPRTESGGGATAETSYGEDQDAAPPQAPYEQQ